MRAPRYHRKCTSSRRTWRRKSQYTPKLAMNFTPVSPWRELSHADWDTCSVKSKAEVKGLLEPIRQFERALSAHHEGARTVSLLAPASR
jgi:hypothetical protein